jgi:hypothetical protein
MEASPGNADRSADLPDGFGADASHLGAEPGPAQPPAEPADDASLAEQLAAALARCYEQARCPQGSDAGATSQEMTSQQLDSLASSFSSCVADRLRRQQALAASSAPAADDATIIDAAAMADPAGEPRLLRCVPTDKGCFQLRNRRLVGGACSSSASRHHHLMRIPLARSCRYPGGRHQPRRGLGRPAARQRPQLRLWQRRSRSWERWRQLAGAGVGHHCGPDGCTAGGSSGSRWQPPRARQRLQDRQRCSSLGSGRAWPQEGWVPSPNAGHQASAAAQPGSVAMHR